MITSPVHRLRARRSSGLRRFAALGVAGAVLVFAAVACQQSPAIDSGTGKGPEVLGVFEFEFGGFASGEVHASVRQLDGAGEVGRSELGTSPLGGISVEPSDIIGMGWTTCGGADYLFSVYDVTSTPARTGVTFIGYASQGFSLEGSAFAEVADLELNRKDGAATITPSIGGPLDCFDGVPALTNPQDLATVVYSDSEISDLEGVLTSSFAFVDTVFPYGFVASNGDSRTLADEGQLKLGFRVPEGVELVRWRAVAVLDDAVRLALPPEFNSRDAGGTDNLVEFATQSAAVSQANGAPVELVVLGEVGEDEDRTLLLDADDWRLGESWNVRLPWQALVDVRIAGGWSGGPTAAYWIGDSGAPSAGVTPFELTVQFKTPGTYAFLPPAGVGVDYLVVAGGGGGAGTALNVTGGGGAGGAGGLVEGTFAADPAATPSFEIVVVGGGGAGGAGGGPNNGLPGYDSEAFGDVAVGGGRGISTANTDGGDGGSGGGARGLSSSSGGSGVEGQGQDGGSTSSADAGAGKAGAGGGGFSAPGGDGGQAIGGAGGSGSDASLYGLGMVAGGGGGGTGLDGTVAGSGGDGGGGDGASGGETPTPAQNGAPNTGGGGGGGYRGAGGDGGSGVAVLRFELP